MADYFGTQMSLALIRQFL